MLLLKFLKVSGRAAPAVKVLGTVLQTHVHLVYGAPWCMECEVFIWKVKRLAASNKEETHSQTEFLAHVMRSREPLENLSLTGNIEGRGGRGGAHIKFMEGIVEEV
ncbi:hypothetical protein Pmani_027148 [Petrolisthes manimaculis]|uniref:Uncharacterized protein n=1 Tax=Petrolisthes manimaculis TaxID=1843537 RepID=A0AAE1P3T0_9EUCA|nr:hypothetical protein Pmani_027148 [Petrolisthes manimaculis]